MSSQSKKGRPMGGISEQRERYGTIGGGQHPGQGGEERQGTQTLRRSSTEEEERQDVETLRQRDVQTEEHQDVKELERSEAKEEDHSNVETEKRQSTIDLERQGARAEERSDVSPEKEVKRERLTVYLDPEQDMKLERIRLKRRARGEKVDKSALIREAIEQFPE